MTIFSALGMVPTAQATSKTNPLDQIADPHKQSIEKKVLGAYEKNSRILVVTVFNKQDANSKHQDVDNSGKPLTFHSKTEFNMADKTKRLNAAKHCVEQNAVAGGRSTTGLDRNAAIAKIKAGGETDEKTAEATADKDAAISKKVVKDLCLADKKNKYASWNDGLLLSAIILAPLAPIIGLIKLIFDQVIERKADRTSEKVWKELNGETLNRNERTEKYQEKATAADKKFAEILVVEKFVNKTDREFAAIVEAQEAREKAEKEKTGTKIQDSLISLTSKSVELQVRATILDEELKEAKKPNEKEKIQVDLDKVIEEAEDVGGDINELETQLSKLGDNAIFSKVIDNVEAHCQALQSEAKDRIEGARERRETSRKEKAERKAAKKREEEERIENEKKALETKLQGSLEQHIAIQKALAEKSNGDFSKRRPRMELPVTIVADPKAAAQATFANLG
jgi:hypothetical protein